MLKGKRVKYIYILLDMIFMSCTCKGNMGKIQAGKQGFICKAKYTPSCFKMNVTDGYTFVLEQDII